MKLPTLFCLVLALAVAAHAELAGTKPNLILVITDDQGYPPMAAHGHPWLKTPNLDRLHGESARFTRFLVAPTCSPTRSAIMTGRHPEKNGITHTILERERMTLDATILPQVLKTAGYRSGIFGKWHLGDEHEYQPDQRGFDETFIHGAGGIGQAYDCSCADAPDNKYTDPVIRHNGSFVQTRGFCTDVFFTAALGWIKQQAEAKQPFFAYLSTNAPHGPFIAPEKNAKRFTDLGFGTYTAGSRSTIDMFTITLALMVGTAGLPHVIVRFFTVPRVSDARRSAGYALLFIAVLYTTAPAVGAMARLNLIDTIQPGPVGTALLLPVSALISANPYSSVTVAGSTVVSSAVFSSSFHFTLA